MVGREMAATSEAMFSEWNGCLLRAWCRPFILVIPLAGFGLYYTATEMLAGYLPTFTDNPSINGGIYTAIVIILAVLEWRWCVTKLDEGVRRLATARTKAPYGVKVS